MSANGITNTGFVSSITNLPIPSSAIDLMAYVEMLLVQEYDEQLKNYADNIKIKTRLKKAYRAHKMDLNNLLNKEQDDGKIKLNKAEYDLLNSRPDFRWDPDMYDGLGGVRDYSRSEEDIFAISNPQYEEVTYDNLTNIVAANETAAWHGDPHFDDPDGNRTTDWDFHGVAGKTYNYLDDSNINMDATHKQWGGGNKTVVGSVDLTINGPNEDSKINFNAESKPTLDGTEMTTGTAYELADGKSTATYDGTNLIVDTPEYKITLIDKGNYLNGTVTTKGNGVMSDGQGPSGVVGQMFDADDDVKFNTNAEAENINRAQYGAPDQNGANEPESYEVKVDRVKAVIEKYQMKLDELNSETELAQTELSTLTSQRKLAFESLSTMISKVFEATSSIVRNIK